MAPAEEQNEKLFPRWSAYGLINGTNPTLVNRPQNVVEGVSQTPSTIPKPSYKPVTVLPADRVLQTTTHAAVPAYSGSGAEAILNGYCETPAYTILDGPTALWVPVVGCISSKADCCPTPTAGSGAAPTNGGDGKEAPGSGPGGGAAIDFPRSSFPAQGTITGCPKDYHTVGGTACCPSSYWLWSTDFGGQVPCYSSLAAEMTPPPIPDTLVNAVTGTNSVPGSARRTTASGSATIGASSIPSSVLSTGKPTLAIVNIAYAMQYPMNVPRHKQTLQKGTKIGIGVGASGAAILIGVLLWFLVRKFMAHNKTKESLSETSVGQRFGAGVDTSYVAHHARPVPNPSEMSRTYEGAKYAGVSTRTTGQNY
ncbi:hypothetical protein BDV96DRAFT_337451 [Lophiotrema nucula]|uniref:Uncharacterized protein n=1 Tax=Lophiotrema nucula TaxID=690887 RepID=A0A6A5YG02_9PLEO|nr:hypothetical protein BDV96DRAFT_337451 [Lophiotrema nucula]